jgi:NADH-quinone oxidoreductase subunit J
MSIAIIVLSVICAALAVTMLFAKNPITSALCLLGVLIMTAAIYGLIGEHLIATIQLVVYAGAIMVLFVFSIMLLNLNQESQDHTHRPLIFFPVVAVGLTIFGLVAYGINQHFLLNHGSRPMGVFNLETIGRLGGNSKVLAHSLFSQFYVSFEVISLALLVAIVGAVVLAKRKID